MAGAIPVWLANWIRRVQRQQVQRRCSFRVHRRSGGTPPMEDLPRRIFGVSEEARDRIRREIHLGVRRRFLSSLRDWLGFARFPRLTPWAMNLSPLPGLVYAFSRIPMPQPVWLGGRR